LNIYTHTYMYTHIYMYTCIYIGDATHSSAGGFGSGNRCASVLKIYLAGSVRQQQILFMSASGSI